MKSALEQAEETLQNKLQQLEQDPEWNSDDDEGDDDEKGETTKDKKNKLQQKKIVKELIKHNDEKNKGIKDSPVIYIGHLPMHMQEIELVAFLKQFGAIVNLRLSRSPKTGRPRGYAFCQFTSSDIAQIVAETLSGYIIAGTKRLVCHVVPTCHRHLFDTKKNFIPTQRRTSPRRKSLAKLKQITTRLLQREGKKRKALAAMGIEYDFPGYAGVSTTDESTKTSKSNNSGDTPSKVDFSREKTKDKKMTKKRKESMDSVQSTDNQQQKKRKDSIASVESNTESRNNKKPKSSIESSAAVTNTKAAPMSEQKKIPTKKDKKRRASN
ncbi:nucleolar protein 15 [Fistulifera solaris]|uniref:Nucleolar protein 15 n=1 Tax=Fistulifera solaris TaxID=1519565 RepID=A0A1Z5JJQ1_FISSO|nr:nucleolar protein 15 [Fistulifera solaris]|eukprot:GAX14018.1 nucleolar protein 15 [Fistulifera solaris]